MHLPCDCSAALTVSVCFAQVEGQNDQLLARAPLVCYAVIYPTGERRMACEVSDVELPTLFLLSSDCRHVVPLSVRDCKCSSPAVLRPL